MAQLNVLHLLARGEAGGIESLSVDLAQKSAENNHFYFLWGGGKNADRIAEITSHKIIRNFKWKRIIKEYRYFYKYCKSNAIQYIVVQGVSPMMLLFATMYKIQNPDIKEILYMHNDAEYVLKSIKNLLPFKIAYHFCDGGIAISNFVRESVLRAIGNNSKMVTIYNGVNVEHFSPSESCGDNHKIRMIYVGRLIEEKGVDNLIQALVKVKSNYLLTIIGDGAYSNQLKKLVKELNLEEKISFVGIQWNVPEWLKKADLFIHPTLRNEGFGITLVEAMASGVPCVAYKKGAIPEIIQDNVNGFIVNECTVDGLAARIESVSDMYFNNKEKWTSIKNRAIKRAMTFSIVNYTNDISRYLRSL